MAAHSNVLAWRSPGTAEPGGRLSMGSQSRTRLKQLSSSSIRAWPRVYKDSVCVCVCTRICTHAHIICGCVFGGEEDTGMQTVMTVRSALFTQ